MFLFFDSWHNANLLREILACHSGRRGLVHKFRIPCTATSANDTAPLGYDQLRQSLRLIENGREPTAKLWFGWEVTLMFGRGRRGGSRMNWSTDLGGPLPLSSQKTITLLGCCVGVVREGWSCPAEADGDPFSTPGRTCPAVSFSAFAYMSGVILKLSY
jgi:hypothetical protein